jgi:truncated hemoglobin YjbI
MTTLDQIEKTTLEHLATQDWSPVEVEAAKAWLKKLFDTIREFDAKDDRSWYWSEARETAVETVLEEPWTPR